MEEKLTKREWFEDLVVGLKNTADDQMADCFCSMEDAVGELGPKDKSKLQEAYDEMISILEKHLLEMPE